MEFDAVVIGSGPAGVSAALGCIERGWRTLVLDEGKTLPLEAKALANALRAGETVKVAKSNGEYRKTLFGSDFSYAHDESHMHVESGLSRSWARGGFSNIWGSAILPYTIRQLEKWKMPMGPWLEAQTRIWDLLNPMGSLKDYAEHAPLVHCKPVESIARLRSPIVDVALKRFRPRKNEVFSASIFGTNSNFAECTGCQLCLTGCPWNILYNAQFSLNLVVSRGAGYRGNFKVTEIRTAAAGFEVVSDGEIVKAKRLFLAAGPIGTAEILIRSKLVSPKLCIKDSQYFLFPAISLFKQTLSVSSVAVAQAFFEHYGDEVEDDFHLQIYDGNTPELRNLIESKLLFGKLIMRILSGRLMIVQGYLHSARSGEISLSKKNDKLLFEGRRPIGTFVAVLRVYLKLVSRSWSLGFLSIPAIQITEPGRGFHSGASLPMKENPEMNSTNMIGELSGSPNLYVVDSSSLPEIPPQTITFSVMTNAFRIVNLAE